MQSLSKYNKGIKYLICAIDLFNKYAWVVDDDDDNDDDDDDDDDDKLFLWYGWPTKDV